jgi:predicted DNA binding CopG/RHH family protein
MSEKKITFPKFRSEDEEADWWASPEGRAYTKQQATKTPGRREGKAAAMIRKAGLMNTQISIRIPDADLEKARAIAQRKGIPYQTYIKMLIHEALAKEAK